MLDKYLQAAKQPWAEETVTASDLAFHRNPKNFINRYIKPSLGTGCPQWVQTPSGTITDDPQEVMEGYHSYFQELYQCTDSQVPTHPIKVTTRGGRGKPCWDGLMAPIEDEEMVAEICHMKMKMAPGPDGLRTPLVKWGAIPMHKEKGEIKVAPTISPLTPMVRSLGLLWNRCLSEERVPDQWKESYITLIPKDEKGVAGDPSRMRPILIASILY